MSDREIEKIWDGLSDIPIDPETEKLDVPYYIWPKGTDKEDIWYWFDENTAGVLLIFWDLQSDLV